MVDRHIAIPCVRSQRRKTKMRQQENVFVRVKTSICQVSVRLPVVNVREKDNETVNWDTSLLSLHFLPSKLCNTSLQVLQNLTNRNQNAHQVDHQSIAKARLELQDWFQKTIHSSEAAAKTTKFGPKNSQYPYFLRHIIPRISFGNNCKIPDEKDSPSKCPFAVQTPVSRFHTDSNHTGFINLWLPMALVQNDHLGFLYHKPSQQLLTASLLEKFVNQESETTGIGATRPISKTRLIRDFLESSCCVLYASPMTTGDAWIFRSGGLHGILHGSIHLNNTDDEYDDGHSGESSGSSENCSRRSVEFRCQPYDYSKNQWIFGEPL